MVDKTIDKYTEWDHNRNNNRIFLDLMYSGLLKWILDELWDFQPGDLVHGDFVESSLPWSREKF